MSCPVPVCAVTAYVCHEDVNCCQSTNSGLTVDHQPHSIESLPTCTRVSDEYHAVCPAQLTRCILGSLYSNATSPWQFLGFVQLKHKHERHQAEARIPVLFPTVNSEHLVYRTACTVPVSTLTPILHTGCPLGNAPP